MSSSIFFYFLYNQKTVLASSKYLLNLLVLLHFNQYTYLVSSLWFFSKSSIRSLRAPDLHCKFLVLFPAFTFAFSTGNFNRDYSWLKGVKICTGHTMNSKKTKIKVALWGSSLSASFLDRSDPGYSINFDFRGRFDLELSSGCLADYVDLQLWEESTSRYTSPHLHYNTSVLLIEGKQHTFSSLVINSWPVLTWLKACFGMFFRKLSL